MADLRLEQKGADGVTERLDIGALHVLQKELPGSWRQRTDIKGFRLSLIFGGVGCHWQGKVLAGQNQAIEPVSPKQVST